jgi:hypothetical protein
MRGSASISTFRPAPGVLDQWEIIRQREAARLFGIAWRPAQVLLNRGEEDTEQALQAACDFAVRQATLLVEFDDGGLEPDGGTDGTGQRGY